MRLAMEQALSSLIATNPVEVRITRTEWLDRADGGRDERLVSLPPFQGRLVPQGRVPRIAHVEAGRLLTRPLLLIAPASASLQPDDRFELGERRFRVVEAVSRSQAGRVWSIHATVEELI